MQEGNLLNTEGKKINYLSQVRRRTKKGTIHPWVATATAWQLFTYHSQPKWHWYAVAFAPTIPKLVWNRREIKNITREIRN